MSMQTPVHQQGPTTKIATYRTERIPDSPCLEILKRKNRRRGWAEGRNHEIKPLLKRWPRADFDFVRENLSSTGHALALYLNNFRCGANGALVLYNRSSRSLYRPSLASLFRFLLRYNVPSGVYRVDVRYSLRILSLNSLLKYHRNHYRTLQFPTLHIATRYIN